MNPLYNNILGELWNMYVQYDLQAPSNELHYEIKCFRIKDPSYLFYNFPLFSLKQDQNEICFLRSEY